MKNSQLVIAITMWEFFSYCWPIREDKMMVELHDTDVTIIGAGPVGMFAAFYAGLRELDVTIIESLASVGGQIANLYPQKHILDIAGYLNATGTQVVADLERQMNQFTQNLQLDTTVTDVVPIESGFRIVTTKGNFKTKALLVATGKGAFEPRRLDSSLIGDLEGHGVYYFMNNPADFTNKRVMVLGGGDSAVDTATMLSEVAAEVHLTHRRENFRAMEHAVTKLMAAEVQLQTPYNVTAIARQIDGALAVTLQKARSTEQKVVVVDDILVSYGFTSENKIVANWQIQPTVLRQKLLVNQTQETSVAGVFAVGDAAEYVGKAELIATGFGEVPTAINQIIRQVYPERQGPVHSSGIIIADGQVKHDLN